MYRIRVNNRTKQLIQNTAEMCHLSVSSIIRTVGKLVCSGRVCPCVDDRQSCYVKHRNGNVVKIKISEVYHRNLDIFVSADNMEFPSGLATVKQFRQCIVAACLDTVNRYEDEYRRLAELERQMQRINNGTNLLRDWQ